MEKIDQVIAQIESQVARIKEALGHAEIENKSLQEEVSLLREKLKETEAHAREYRSKYDEIARAQTSAPSANEDAVTEGEIDALVREIDTCINRLKAE
ncbi:MAG: hypothetical protein ACQERC_07120 [Bacteroidota bacterium]